MELEKFTSLRPYLYHLTSAHNLPYILSEKKLISTSRILGLADSDVYGHWLMTRRPKHVPVVVGEKIYWIRDQKPVSETNLAKCLTHNLTMGQFYEHLNDRVFMWAKLSDLQSHYDRYSHEEPVILRFDTEDIIKSNPHVKFCEYNSGATRSSHYYAGGPPPRGLNTFRSASDFPHLQSKVKEVTFENECILDGEIFTSSSPTGIYLSGLHTA